MPVVLHGYESWSLILREVNRLSIFESRVLRKVCGPRWREVKGGLRKCHNGQLDDVYSSQNTIIFIKSKGMSLITCTTYGRQEQQTNYPNLQHGNFQ